MCLLKGDVKVAINSDKVAVVYCCEVQQYALPESSKRVGPKQCRTRDSNRYTATLLTTMKGK
jgi:hypothetical protein